MLTVKDAAHRLRVNHNIIYEEIRRGELRALKTDTGRVFIKPDDLDRYGKAFQQGRPTAIRKPPQDEIIGRNLKEIRLNSINPKTGTYYTQRELGMVLKVSQNTIKNLELNRRNIANPNLKKYIAFADAQGFEVTPMWILWGIGADPFKKKRH